MSSTLNRAQRRQRRAQGKEASAEVFVAVYIASGLTELYLSKVPDVQKDWFLRLEASTEDQAVLPILLTQVPAASAFEDQGYSNDESLAAVRLITSAIEQALGAVKIMTEQGNGPVEGKDFSLLVHCAKDAESYDRAGRLRMMGSPTIH